MDGLDVTIEDWVRERPYLKEIAQLQKIIEAVIKKSGGEAVTPYVPGEGVLEEFKRGIPILKTGENLEGFMKEVENLIVKMIDALVTASLPGQIITQSLQVKAAFAEKEDLVGCLVAEAVKDSSVKDSKKDLGEVSEGFLLFLVWKALSHVLEPLKEKVSMLLEEDPWLRGYCPVCGQLPAMAHLLKTEKGRERNLICGCCQMHWRFKRMGCPYCGNEDQKTLEIIGLDEEPDLRVDTCKECEGYLKTYIGEGQELAALTDWSTLHLDLVAKKQGFKRIGYQMYGI
ncbi:MAG: formate dehydrogenase accessory protein FdhE [Firmicutes bacterium]|nr:formate dehydrogenase accessory protein FdhE [Bacillota bacterium]